jgi:hypothetical protein
MKVIPPIVFYVFLAIDILFYSIAIPLYILRINIFPIVNRVPVVSVIQMTLLAALSLWKLLLGAFPENVILSNCQFQTMGTAVLTNLTLIMMVYRLCWLIIRDYKTKYLLQQKMKRVNPDMGSAKQLTSKPGDNKSTEASAYELNTPEVSSKNIKDLRMSLRLKKSTATASDSPALTPLLNERKTEQSERASAMTYTNLVASQEPLGKTPIERFLAYSLEFVSPRTLTFELLIPMYVATITIIIVLVKENDVLSQVRNTSELCGQAHFGAAGGTTAATLIAGSILIFATRSILKLNDSLGFAAETRYLLIPMLFHLSLIICGLVLFYLNSATILETGWWEILIGAVTAPSLVAIQSLYPLYLSFHHEIKERASIKKREFMKRILDSSIQVKILLTEDSFHGKSVSEHEPVDEIEHALRHRSERKEFFKFLESEFVVENVLFYEATRDFRRKYHLKTKEEITASAEAWKDARYICDIFVMPSAIGAVDISENARKNIIRVIRGSRTSIFQQPKPEENIPLTAEVFEEARKEILHVILTDTYPRYLAYVKEGQRHHSHPNTANHHPKNENKVEGELEVINENS